VVLADLPGLRRAARRAELLEEVDVDLVVVLPLLGDVVLVVDGLDRAHRLARPAVHTLVRVDVEHALALVDAVHRALFDAGPVKHIDAGQRDDVGHVELLCRPGAAGRSRACYCSAPQDPAGLSGAGYFRWSCWPSRSPVAILGSRPTRSIDSRWSAPH